MWFLFHLLIPLRCFIKYLIILVDICHLALYWKWELILSIEKMLNTCNYCLPRWRSGKESACHCRRHERHRFNPWVGNIPWSRKWHPTPVFLSRKFRGQRLLVVYSPWGHKESDTTEHAQADYYYVHFENGSSYVIQ